MIIAPLTLCARGVWCVQGWLGDAQLSGEESQYNFDMVATHIKFLNDIVDEQARALPSRALAHRTQATGGLYGVLTFCPLHLCRPCCGVAEREGRGDGHCPPDLRQPARRPVLGLGLPQPRLLPLEVHSTRQCAILVTPA